MIAATPTLGILIGIPAAALLFLAGLVLFFYAWTRQGEGDSYDADFSTIMKWGAFAWCIIVLVVSAFAFWPYEWQYHSYAEKGGEVSDVSKRLVSAGENSMQEKIVMTIDGEQYGVLDTRAALVKPGDHVSIACKRVYEWGSSNHGWDCKWNGELVR